MPGPKRGISLATVLSVVLAGCAASDDPDADAAGGSAPTGFSDETGVLLGTVTDDEFRPIAGAEVGVLEAELLTTTDADGRFRFDSVPPGEYALVAQRLGFESIASRAIVVAGQVTEVGLVLQPLAVVEAYHVTYNFRGHMTCGADLIVLRLVTVCGTTGGPAGNITVDPNERNEFPQEGLPTLATVLGEVVWEPTAALAAAAFRINLYQGWLCDPFCSADYSYGQEEGPSPLVLRSDGEFDGLEDGPATISHFVSVTDDPPFVVFVVQQDYDLYSTHFHGLEAPATFSARPDA